MHTFLEIRHRMILLHFFDLYSHVEWSPPYYLRKGWISLCSKSKWNTHNLLSSLWQTFLHTQHYFYLLMCLYVLTTRLFALHLPVNIYQAISITINCSPFHCNIQRTIIILNFSVLTCKIWIILYPLKQITRRSL